MKTRHKIVITTIGTALVLELVTTRAALMRLQRKTLIAAKVLTYLQDKIDRSDIVIDEFDNIAIATLING